MSKSTVLACALLFVAGVVGGAVAYTRRSFVVEEHVPGSNAVPGHLVLGLVAVGLVVGLPRPPVARQAPYPIWVAPFSQSGFDRFRDTLKVRSDGPPINIVRAIPAGLLAILLLYNFLRAGWQILAGLDPNFTVNAWGGLGYFGALMAHYLDAGYLFYIEALLLNYVLVRQARPSPTT
jgi:hypothetical protein